MHIYSYLMENDIEQLIKIVISSNKYDFKSKNSEGDTLLHLIDYNEIEILPSLIEFSDVN